MVSVVVVFVFLRRPIVSVVCFGIRGVMAPETGFSIDTNVKEVLIALISMIGGYLSGYRKGRQVYRSGDYRPKDMLE